MLKLQKIINTRRFILFLIVIGFISIPNFVYATRPITYPPECCTELEFICDSNPCTSPIDCRGKGQCVKIVNEERFACKLKNPQQFIDVVKNYDEFQSFITLPQVELQNTSASLYWGCAVRVYLKLKISTQDRWYVNLDSLPVDVKNGKSEIVYEGMKYNDILTAINLAEENERVKYWNEKYPHKYGDNIYFFDGVELHYDMFRKPTPTHTIAYGLVYSYDYNKKEGRIKKYSAPLDDLPDFEEVKIALQNPEINKFLEGQLNGHWAAYNRDGVWKIELIPSGSSAKKEIEINISSQQVDIAETAQHPSTSIDKDSSKFIYPLISVLIICIGIISLYFIRKIKHKT